MRLVPLQALVDFPSIVSFTFLAMPNPFIAIHCVDIVFLNKNDSSCWTHVFAFPRSRAPAWPNFEGNTTGFPFIGSFFADDRLGTTDLFAQSAAGTFTSNDFVFKKGRARQGRAGTMSVFVKRVRFQAAQYEVPRILSSFTERSNGHSLGNSFDRKNLLARPFSCREGLQAGYHFVCSKGAREASSAHEAGKKLFKENLRFLDRTRLLFRQFPDFF
jgi:hypothetical protein